MGEDDALERMKKALVESQPSLPWDDVMGKYKALADTEDAAYLAVLGTYLSVEESEGAEEEANATEVGRFEELTSSTTDMVDPSTS